MKTDRRNFMRSATLLSAAAAVPLVTVQAGCELGDSGLVAQPAGDPRERAWREMAAELKTAGVYTPDNPGIWAGKEGSHTPQISLVGQGVEALTSHAQGPEDKPGHYILCHFVEGSDGTVFDFRLYTRQALANVTSLLAVPETYSGPVTVYSYCTEHDLWASELVA